MDNNNAAATGGNKIQMWDCDGNTAAQTWTVASNGTLQIDGGCMDITGASNSNGTLIEWWTVQRWRQPAMDGLSNGNWSTRPPANAWMTPPPTPPTGRNSILYTCNGGSNQHWTLP